MTMMKKKKKKRKWKRKMSEWSRRVWSNNAFCFVCFVFSCFCVVCVWGQCVRDCSWFYTRHGNPSHIRLNWGPNAMFMAAIDCDIVV